MKQTINNLDQIIQIHSSDLTTLFLNCLDLLTSQDNVTFVVLELTKKVCVHLPHNADTTHPYAQTIPAIAE